MNKLRKMRVVRRSLGISMIENGLIRARDEEQEKLARALGVLAP